MAKEEKSIVGVPPLLARVVKHLDDQEGRDKVGKMIQYAARFLMYQALQSDPKSDFGNRMKGLFTIVREARKLSRLFKSLAEYKKFMEGVAKPSSLTRNLDLVARLGMGTYWFFDNLSFLGKGKVIEVNQTNVSWYGAFGWFVGTFFGLLGNLVKLSNSFNTEAQLLEKARTQLTKDSEESKKTSAELDKLLYDRTTIYINLVKNACDCSVAANGIDIWLRLLGYKLNDGVLGLSGFIAGSCANYIVWSGRK